MLPQWAWAIGGFIMRTSTNRCAAIPIRPLLALLLVILLVLFITPATARAGDPATLEGTWTGSLQTGNGELHAVFHIKKNGNAYGGTMDSPDQGFFGVNCNLVAAKDDNVRIVLAIIGAQFIGKLSGDGKEIAGYWQQLNQRLPLSLKRTQIALVPDGVVLVFWAVVLALSALFLRLACSLCQASTPSWRRASVSVLVVAGLAYLTADFTAYLIMRSLQDVFLQVPPWYSYQSWFHEPIALKWIIISHAGPLRYLPFVFALCVAGMVQVIVLQAEVTFRFGLLIVLLQWVATVAAGYVVSLLIGVVMQGATLPETPVAHVPPAGDESGAISLQVVRRQTGDAAQTSREYAEKAWHNLNDYANPYLDELKRELAPITRRLPQAVQDFLENGGWWAVFGVLALIALAWLRSLMRKFYRAIRRTGRKKNKRRIRSEISLKENLADIGPAMTDEGPMRVTIRGLPVRLRLVVLSSGTRGGELSEAMADRILDWIKPGLAEITAPDTPAVRVWPPFFSADGFANAFRANVPIPQPQGTKSHWILVVGHVSMGKSIIHVGLGFHADDENNLRTIRINEEQWLSVLGVKASLAPV